MQGDMIMRNHLRFSRSLPLRLTNLEARVAPAVSVYGPYTPMELHQLSTTGGNAWQMRYTMPAAPVGVQTYYDLDAYLPASLNLSAIQEHLSDADTEPV